MTGNVQADTDVRTEFVSYDSKMTSSYDVLTDPPLYELNKIN